jgi:3-oxoacyl-[acyl-carrier protein] reductase
VCGPKRPSGVDRRIATIGRTVAAAGPAPGARRIRYPAGMDLELSGKRTLVAGASRGIGRAIAHALAREGARVCAVARGADGLAALAGELPGTGHATVVADVATAAGADAAIAGAVAALGGLDVVVCNVGKSFGRTVAELDDDDLARSLDLNLWSSARVARRAVAPLTAAGGGAIVLVSSIWGREAGGAPGYNIAKAGVIALGKALARDLASADIRVNTVAPGSILFPRRRLGSPAPGRPRRHRRVRRARAALRSVRRARGGGRRRDVPVLGARALGQRRLCRRRRRPVAGVLAPGAPVAGALTAGVAARHRELLVDGRLGPLGPVGLDHALAQEPEVPDRRRDQADAGGADQPEGPTQAARRLAHLVEAHLALAQITSSISGTSSSRTSSRGLGPPRYGRSRRAPSGDRSTTRPGRSRPATTSVQKVATSMRGISRRRSAQGVCIM